MAISNAAPWENLKFNVDGIAEVQRKFGTLHNTYAFFCALREHRRLPLQRSGGAGRGTHRTGPLDPSELHTLVRTVDASYANTNPPVPVVRYRRFRQRAPVTGTFWPQSSSFLER